MNDSIPASADPKSEQEMLIEPRDCSAQHGESEVGELCPLFMDGLPSDFATNTSLAAIASLLGDAETDEKSVVEPSKPELPKPQAGGGKVKSSSKRSNRKSEPYNKRDPGSKKETVTAGEASLFLQMWKL